MPVMTATVKARPWTMLTLITLAYAVGFSVVWGGAHWLTEQHAERWPLYFDWEAQLPFQAWALPLYFSMDVVVMIAPFLFTRWQPAAALMSLFFIQLCIAAPSFVVVPIEPGFINDMPTGVWGAWLFEPLGLHNMSQYNHTPSLHVTYALTLAVGLKHVCSPWVRWPWAIAVCCTTLLVHEHHLICIGGGLLLFAVTIWMRPRLEQWFTARQMAGS